MCQIRCATAQLHASSIGLPAANASAVFSTIAQSHPVTNSRTHAAPSTTIAPNQFAVLLREGRATMKKKKRVGCDFIWSSSI